MIVYIIKSSVLLALCYLLYILLLRRENALVFRRYYLGLSLFLSLLVPLIQFNFFDISDFWNLSAGRELNNETLGYITSSGFSETVTQSDSGSFSILPWLIGVYLIGVLLLAIRFTRNIVILVQKIKNSQMYMQVGKYKVIESKPSTGIFSFYNSIFVHLEEGEQIDQDILNHELGHLKQRHFIDLLIVECIQLLYWFNPVIPLYKKAIKENHEFLADREVVGITSDVRAYSEKILQHASKNRMVFASGFSYSLIKERMIMLGRYKARRASACRLAIIGVSASLLMLVFSAFTMREVVTKEQAIDYIRTVNERIDYHNGALTELEQLTDKSENNFNSFVRMGQLIENFGHSTGSVLAIARIASDSKVESELYLEIAELLFLDYKAPYWQYIELAQQVNSSSQVDEIKSLIDKYKQNSQFKSIDEALKHGLN